MLQAEKLEKLAVSFKTVSLLGMRSRLSNLDSKMLASLTWGFAWVCNDEEMCLMHDDAAKKKSCKQISAQSTSIESPLFC